MRRPRALLHALTERASAALTDGRRRAALMALAILSLLFAVLVVAWPSVEAGGKATLLVTDGVLRSPVRPLTWTTDDPKVEELQWEHGGRGIFRRPDGEGRSAAVVLTLGASPAGPDDPRVVRLLDTLARLGLAVLLPVSDDLMAGIVSPIDVRRLVGAFETLAQHPNVRPDRVGFAGLSAGGSLVIVAAADPAISDRVWFVMAVGPYYDAGSLVASTVSETIRTPKGEEPWKPEGTTRHVVRATLLSTLSADERRALETGGAALTEEGKQVSALLRGSPLQQAEAILSDLGPGQGSRLEAVSPRYAVDLLRARLYLLHDKGDEYIPWTESEALNRAYPASVYLRLELFRHVEPDIGNVPVLARDSWRLIRLFHRIFREADE